MRVLLNIALILLSVHVFGQDIHLSQFYTTPATINPAMTGAFNGTYRLQANAKEQWASLARSPYQTFGGSADLAIPLKYDLIGVGLSVLQDVAGVGGLQRFKASVNLAYHIALGLDQINDLSFGFQYSFVQRSVNSEYFVMPDQYNGDFYFDRFLPSGEAQLEFAPIGYQDMAAGVHWFYTPEDLPAIYAGFSAFHINRPLESFFGTVNAEPLKIRYNLHGATRIFLDDKYSIMPKMNISRTGSNMQMIIGVEGEYYYINTSVEKVSVFGAGFYRIGDAVAIIGGLDIAKIRLGLSYDINVSALSVATGGKGGFEFSITYKGTLTRFQGYKCPKFDASF